MADNSSNASRFAIGAFFFLLGPVSLAAYGYYFFNHTDPMTAHATATVVRFETYQGGGSSVSNCPVFTWTAEGHTYEEESNYCEASYTVGSEVEIRFDPTDVGEVVPDIAEAQNDEAIPIVIATLLCSVISGFFLWPRKKRG